MWDNHNGKLIGIIAIGDPVFNLSVRDNLIDWDAQARGKRLVNIMDAYVLGALPPYNALLGGNGGNGGFALANPGLGGSRGQRRPRECADEKNDEQRDAPHGRGLAWRCS